PYVHYLHAFAQRRRANIYFKNEQSIFHGVQVNFVNVGSGNLTFARRDLVVPGQLPLIGARVYDSAGVGSGDFGPGWRLSAAERIELADGRARLFTETGDQIEFVAAGDSFVLARDFPSDYLGLLRLPSGDLLLTQG